MSEPVYILLVEDNPADIKLTRLAFKEFKLANQLSIVRDGVEAVAYLKKQGEYVDSPRPDLILLDLNLPRMDGREVLREIKNDEDLKTIPVVVLTTSSDDKDILASYSHHANSYITKPVNMEGLLTIVHIVENFWFTIVKLPRRD